MRILVFDTSIPYTTAGWVHFAGPSADADIRDFAQLFLPAKPGHTETLLDRLDLVLRSGGLDLGQIDLLVHGLGPGTFTGLRIGFSTARALHLAHGLPAVGISTLRIAAASARHTGTVVPLIDARRNEVYCGAFAVSGQGDTAEVTPLMPECVLPTTAVAQHLDAADVPRPRFFTGYAPALLSAYNAAAPLDTRQSPQPFSVTWTARAGLARFLAQGADDPHTTEPAYLREPDARLPAQPLVIRDIAKPASTTPK